MTAAEIKKEINSILDRLPEPNLSKVLELVQQLEIEDKTLDNIRRILEENRNYFIVSLNK